MTIFKVSTFYVIQMMHLALGYYLDYQRNGMAKNQIKQRWLLCLCIWSSYVKNKNFPLNMNFLTFSLVDREFAKTRFSDLLLQRKSVMDVRNMTIWCVACNLWKNWCQPDEMIALTRRTSTKKTSIKRTSNKRNLTKRTSSKRTSTRGENFDLEVPLLLDMLQSLWCL